MREREGERKKERTDSKTHGERTICVNLNKYDYVF